MAKKTKTAAERRHHGLIAEMPCVLCDLLGQPQASNTTVHHIREGQGMAQRASHWLAIPLCRDCHQGDLGIHGDRTLLRIANVNELDLLALTIERVFGRAA